MVVIASLMTLSTGVAAAQRGEDRPLVEELRNALRLRDAGDYAGAARMLESYVRAHPTDAYAARLLAETLYWSGDVAAARASWAEALRRHPQDISVRLEYGRMLVQLNDSDARALLEPLRVEPAIGAEVEFLLGMLEYWAGDLSSAKSRFETALRHSPEHPRAATALDEIRRASRPWFRAEAALERDTQPLSQRAGGGELGAYLTPLNALLVQFDVRRHDASDSARTVVAAGGTYRGYWPALRLDTELAGAILTGTALDGAEWTGRATLGVRLPLGLAITLAAERELYLRTAASITSPVLLRSLEARVDWTTGSGWIGQAAWRHGRYPDDNSGEALYGWVLAPLLRRPALELRAGYAYGQQDTRETRFVPNVFGDGTTASGGRYVPYHTPADQRTHGVAAAVAIAPGAAVSFRANGSYGFRASEAAPYFFNSPTAGEPPVLGFYERSYHPFEARGALGVALSPALHAQLEIEHTRAAYWDTTRGSIALLHRFGIGAGNR